MFGLDVVQIQDYMYRLQKAADRAAFIAFARAAYRIYKDAQASIKDSPDHSAPGKPPHTRKGKLRRAIAYYRDKEEALIGPMASRVGKVGQPHELGGSFKKNTYPARPFMGPAMERDLSNFANDFAGSIGP